MKEVEKQSGPNGKLIRDSAMERDKAARRLSSFVHILFYRLKRFLA